MNERKPIAVVGENVPTLPQRWIKYLSNISLDEAYCLLYVDGKIELRLPDKVSRFYLPELSTELWAQLAFAHGSDYADNWYWDDSEKRLVDMATLSDEKYLEVTMSNTRRVRIEQPSEYYLEVARIRASISRTNSFVGNK